MANIQVRKENPEDRPTTTRPTNVWEPFRTMRQLMGWDPFREIEMMPLLNEPSFAPAFEVKETKDGYMFKADVPGVKESDIEVTMTGNRLSISGKREEEKKEQTDTFYTYERSYGSFQRTFTMPDGVDASTVHADLKDGVLTVGMKKRPEAQPQKIAVKTPTQKS